MYTYIYIRFAAGMLQDFPQNEVKIIPIDNTCVSILGIVPSVQLYSKRENFPYSLKNFRITVP